MGKGGWGDGGWVVSGGCACKRHEMPASYQLSIGSLHSSNHSTHVLSARQFGANAKHLSVDSESVSQHAGTRCRHPHLKETGACDISRLERKLRRRNELHSGDALRSKYARETVAGKVVSRQRPNDEEVADPAPPAPMIFVLRTGDLLQFGIFTRESLASGFAAAPRARNS
jgi:hypothetical protein